MTSTGLRLNPHTEAQEALQVEAMRRLMQEMPNNEYGIPVGFYRVDLLPFHDYLPQTQQEVMMEALADGEGSDGYTGWKPFQIAGPEDVNDDTVMSTDDVSPADVEEQTDEVMLRPSEELQRQHVVQRKAGFPVGSIQSAFVPLHFDEGYPALPDGRKFWDQLDCESLEAYTAFICYLQMAQTDGSRTLADLPERVATTGMLNGHEPNEYLLKFQHLSHIHMWPVRAKAYDLFRTTAFRKQMDQRAIDTQNDHYLRSRHLMVKIWNWIDNEENFFDMLTPKTAIDALKTLTQLQRISAGLPGAAPMSAEQEESLSSSFEMIYRRTAQHENAASVFDEDGQEVILRDALNDPQTLTEMQELIVRMSKPRK